MFSMRITWIVIGAILALKGIAALIYFCCCRKNNRRRQQNQQHGVRIGVNVPGNQNPSPYPATNYPPYVVPEVQVDAPPSYDDLVKDGVLNVAYEHPQCEGGAHPPAAAGPSAPTPNATSDLPPPPPYYAPPATAAPPTMPSLPSQDAPGARQ